MPSEWEDVLDSVQDNSGVNYTPTTDEADVLTVLDANRTITYLTVEQKVALLWIQSKTNNPGVNVSTDRKFLQQHGNATDVTESKWDLLTVGDIPSLPIEKITDLSEDLMILVGNIDARVEKAWRINKRLAADFSTTGGYDNVNNGSGDALSFDIGAGEIWTFEAHLGTGSTTTSGLRVSISGSQTPTSFRAESYGNTSAATASTWAVGTSYGFNSGIHNTANNQTGQVHISGCIDNTGAAADTIYVQLLSFGGQSVTVKQNSYIVARRLA